MIEEPARADLDTNVLVVGGGFAGTWAAIEAAHKTDKVVLVDKAYVSRGGGSTMSGGVTTAPLATHDISDWVEELVRLGGYVADQDWTWKLVREQIDRVQDLLGWGVPIVHNENGSIRRVKSRGMVVVRALQLSPIEAMEILRAKAVEAGVQILDKVAITDLLTSDGTYPTRGRVCGALGLDIRSGAINVIHAKSVVLATGPMSMKGYRPVDNVCGEGIAMAHRVGAKFLDLEFMGGGSFEVIWGDLRFNNYNISVGNGAKLINARGERFMTRYDPERLERSELNRVCAAAFVEMLDGRGPVYLDLRECTDRFWEAVRNASAGRKVAVLTDAVPDPRKVPLPIEPTWSFWSGGEAGVVIDIDCKTTVPGLLAAGVVARNPAVGRHGSAGAPTAFAMVSGHHAGGIAAAEANGQPSTGPEPRRLDELCRQLTAGYRPDQQDGVDQFYDDVAAVSGSPLDLMVQSEESIKRALAQFQELRTRVPTVTASSTHNLVKLHEARNTLESSELIYECMLDRTESREAFYRSDHPYTDDSEWLCWHTVRREGDRLQFERERVPFERFRFKPPKMRRMISPMAAIFGRDYDPANYEMEKVAS